MQTSLRMTPGWPAPSRMCRSGSPLPCSQTHRQQMVRWAFLQVQLDTHRGHALHLPHDPQTSLACTHADRMAAQWQQKARSAARDPGSEDSSDSDNEPLAADHPDYHGRGWRPSRAQPVPEQTSAGKSAAAAHKAGSNGARWDAISSDGSDSDDEGRTRQPLKEVSTRREQGPAAEPQE